MSRHPSTGNPPAGNTCERTAKIVTSATPTTKVGTAKPSCEIATAATPLARRRRNAERCPTMVATATAMTDDTTTSGTVTSSRAAISPRTSSPDTREVPRSPRAASPSQSKYCAAIERSNPYSARSCANAAGVASMPSRDVAMSPGSTRSTTNTKTVEKSTPPRATPRRRAAPLISARFQTRSRRAT